MVHMFAQYLGLKSQYAFGERENILKVEHSHEIKTETMYFAPRTVPVTFLEQYPRILKHSCLFVNRN